MSRTREKKTKKNHGKKRKEIAEEKRNLKTTNKNKMAESWLILSDADFKMKLRTSQPKLVEVIRIADFIFRASSEHCVKMDTIFNHLMTFSSGIQRFERSSRGWKKKDPEALAGFFYCISVFDHSLCTRLIEFCTWERISIAFTNEIRKGTQCFYFVNGKYRKIEIGKLAENGTCENTRKLYKVQLQKIPLRSLVIGFE